MCYDSITIGGEEVDNKVVIGNKIKEARLKKKMLQKELATQLGTSYVVVGRWERAESLPSLVYQRRIEKILKIKL